PRCIMPSLSRILEPEVMDSAEEARDYDAMDHSAVNRVFVADFLAVWDGARPILDLGTGTAQIPIALCRQDSRATVTAVDAASHAGGPVSRRRQRAPAADVRGLAARGAESGGNPRAGRGCRVRPGGRATDDGPALDVGCSEGRFADRVTGVHMPAKKVKVSP